MNENSQPAARPKTEPAPLPQAPAPRPGPLARLARGAGQLKGFLRRHKKGAVLLAAALCAAGTLGVWRAAGRPAAGMPSPPAGASYVRTVTLARTTLENSVSASGTVESVQVSTVTTALAYPVKTVEVQVGDTVSAGEVICTLDTEELERQIEQRQQTADRAVRRAQESLEEAQQSRDEAAQALTEAGDAEGEAKDAYNAAWDAFNAALAKVTQFRSAYEQAYDALQTALSNYNAVYTPAYQAAAARYEQAAAKAAEAEAAYAAAVSAAGTAPAGPDAADAGEEAARLAQEEAKAAEEAAQLALETARAEEEAARQALDEAYAAAEAARTAYEQAQQQEQAASAAFTQAKRDCNYDSLKAAKDAATTQWEAAKTARENAAAQLERAEKSLASARTALEEAGEDEELESLRRSLEDCTLTAGSAGTVTSLNATVGSKCSGTVATIQDTGALKVAFTLAEYDVGNVAVGMQAVVTSDATDQPIAGRLTQISPTTSAAGGDAAGSSAASSNSGGFAAEVTLTGDADGLRIGMNAKVEIIQSAAEDVFVVPCDAVGQNEDGSRYILVRQDGADTGEAFAPVPVTTGAENDYYIEVRGEALREGMVVRASLLEEEAQTVPEDAAGPNITFAGPGMGGGMGAAPAGGPMGGGMP